MTPERIGRRRSGQLSTTRATPSAHSPPMPSGTDEAENAQLPRLCGEVASAGKERIDKDAQAPWPEHAPSGRPASRTTRRRMRAEEERGHDERDHLSDLPFTDRGAQQVLQGRAETAENSPISAPSNIHPARAAVSTSHRPTTGWASDDDNSASADRTLRFMRHSRRSMSENHFPASNG